MHHKDADCSLSVVTLAFHSNLINHLTYHILGFFSYLCVFYGLILRNHAIASSSYSVWNASF